MNKKLTIVFIGMLAASGTAFAAPKTRSKVSTDSFGDAIDLLKQLKEQASAFSDDKVKWDGYKDDFVNYTGKFKAIEDSRKEVFDCIYANYAMLVKNLDDCLANKEAITNEHELAKKDLLAQIDALKKSTDAEIASLTESIFDLNNQISSYKERLITLTSVTQNDIDEALARISTMRTQYAEMLASRISMYSELDRLIARINAHYSNTDKALEKINSEICE